MIFNVMENKEELLFALKELREGEVSDISSNLEQYILHVSKTGETMFAWQLIQPLLTQKLRRVSDDFYAEMPTDQLPSRPNTEHVQFHELQSRVLEHINRFSGTPFTIQRLCELLVNPRSHYTRPDKFLRGIEKIVMVVSTVEAMKVANGSVASACSDDETSDAEKASGPGLNGVWCGPPSPSGKLSPNRPASPALDLTDRPDRPGPLSPTHPLSTGPKAHPMADSDLAAAAALRPMGQLEAFVQNVSQRLTNQICSPGKEEGRLSGMLPEEGERPEGNRKREVPAPEVSRHSSHEEEGQRPAKVPRLADWEEKEEAEGKEDGDSPDKSSDRSPEKPPDAVERLPKEPLERPEANAPKCEDATEDEPEKAAEEAPEKACDEEAGKAADEEVEPSDAVADKGEDDVAESEREKAEDEAPEADKEESSEKGEDEVPKRLESDAPEGLPERSPERAEMETVGSPEAGAFEEGPAASEMHQGEDSSEREEPTEAAKIPEAAGEEPLN